jgi:Piwi domain
MNTPASSIHSTVRELSLPYRGSRTSQTPGDSLITNFFPAEFSSDSVTVWAGRWTSGEDIDALKAANPTLSTWRDPDDAKRLYAWDTDYPDATPPIGFKIVTVSHEESPQLFQRLMLDAVRTRLAVLGFIEKDGGGFVNFDSKNLLAEIPALSGVVGASIGIYPKIVIEGFFTKTAMNALASGIIVDVLYTTRMDVTAAEWMASGMGEALLGTYVKLIRGSSEAARFPQFEGTTVGRIAGIRGDRCVLDDVRDPALADISATSVSPEPTRANLTKYLLARHEHAYRVGEKDLVKRLREVVRPYTRHRYAEALVQKRIQGSNAPWPGLPLIQGGVTVRFSTMAQIGPEMFPARRLNTPEYSFDPAGEKFARRVDEGLQRHGPYDSPQMRRRQFRILVVAPAEHEGEATVAVQKLTGGLRTQQNVFAGLKKMYRLEDLQVTQAIAEPRFGVSMQGYSEAVRRALDEAPPSPPGEPKFHLLLTVIRESHRELADSENPYLQLKGLALVREHVPTQAIFVEKIRQRDYELQYILNTMALAIYAKLGGTSHVLKVGPKSGTGDAHTELIFGVGRDIRKSSRFDCGEETIGFATVFRANGEYLYNDCTPYCVGSEYEKALETTIRRTVERVAAFEQLEDGAKVRLIFHLPRRPGKREERAILNAVGKLPRFDIDFALVHVNDDHHLQLFDIANTSPRSRSGKARPEAALLPARGLSIAIGPRERLVTFVGPDQYKGNGSPSPIRLTLDKRSTFTDLDYLTQQMYSLSFMSVRSLTPGIAPVTISYAERLAHITGRLRSVSNWAVELIQDKLGRKLWFP